VSRSSSSSWRSSDLPGYETFFGHVSRVSLSLAYLVWRDTIGTVDFCCCMTTNRIAIMFDSVRHPSFTLAYYRCDEAIFEQSVNNSYQADSVVVSLSFIIVNFSWNHRHVYFLLWMWTWFDMWVFINMKAACFPNISEQNWSRAINETYLSLVKT
jgi:hypothetical protein